MNNKDALISIRTKKELKEKLSFISAKEDRSFSSQVVRFLKQGVSQWEETNKTKASHKLR